MARRDKGSENPEDIEFRIRKLKEEVGQLAGGEMISEVSPDCPPEIEEEFWKNVADFENAAWVQPFELLSTAGIALTSPDELDDTQITAKLWEVINGLALLGAYLYSTDHLSDRELYAHLWSESLREEMVIQPHNPDFACHIDVVGSGSEEHTQIYLKYYADDDHRRRWAEEWPDDPLPDHADPPFDRDRRLPRPGWESQVQTH